jgi:hypothetical protein
MNMADIVKVRQAVALERRDYPNKTRADTQEVTAYIKSWMLRYSTQFFPSEAADILNVNKFTLKAAAARFGVKWKPSQNPACFSRR